MILDSETMKSCCNVSPPTTTRLYRSVVVSCGLLIQHLSHSEQHLRSWPFLQGASNLSTPTHADTQMLLPALTSLHTASSCPKFKPPPWEITQSLSNHRGMKYTPLESNSGGWRECECVRSTDGKKDEGRLENAKRNEQECS